MENPLVGGRAAAREPCFILAGEGGWLVPQERKVSICNCNLPFLLLHCSARLPRGRLLCMELRWYVESIPMQQHVELTRQFLPLQCMPLT